MADAAPQNLLIFVNGLNCPEDGEDAIHAANLEALQRMLPVNNLQIHHHHNTTASAESVSEGVLAIKTAFRGLKAGAAAEFDKFNTWVEKELEEDGSNLKLMGKLLVGSAALAGAVTGGAVFTAVAVPAAGFTLYKDLKKQAKVVAAQLLEKMQLALKDAPADCRPTIYLVGHSHGGAVVREFLAMCNNSDVPVDWIVWVFGSPCYVPHALNFRHKNDPVPLEATEEETMTVIKLEGREIGEEAHSFQTYATKFTEHSCTAQYRAQP